jgi:hypothetical protein
MDSSAPRAAETLHEFFFFLMPTTRRRKCVIHNDLLRNYRISTDLPFVGCLLSKMGEISCCPQKARNTHAEGKTIPSTYNQKPTDKNNGETGPRLLIFQTD